MKKYTSTLPLMALLAVVVVHWIAGQGSGRIIQLGESLWPGYATELRREVKKPEPREETNKQFPTKTDKANASDDSSDDALIDDLLGETAPTKKSEQIVDPYTRKLQAWERQQQAWTPTSSSI